MAVESGGEVFRDHLRACVSAACRGWGWPAPGQDYYLAAEGRLPAGLRTILGEGIAQGLIQTDGWVFTLKGLAPGKGPYRWLSQREWMRGPHPNWEYFVQVGEFVRLHRVAAAHDLRLDFEDDLMVASTSRTT